MLEGKIVAISGAAGGLGPTVARAFFKAGATLCVGGRSMEGLTRTLDLLQVPAARRMATVVDLLDASAAKEWAEAIQKRFGRIDIVLHLVGGYKGGTSIAELDPADWSSLNDMLVRTTLNVARAFAGPIKTGGWGRFIAVTSPKARTPTAKTALYAMGKAASDALVLALADELRGTGATANLIEVDSIDSPETRDAQQKKAYGKSTPAEEIAAAMVFLCTDEAATINGARLPLTGRG
ncbi:MAG: SDR family oxidoreductase [Spirochaetia bacterium]|jgi:NAD(P)-dependent dehydrogenase (short-subunit alcohol dehydrogenase family)